MTPYSNQIVRMADKRRHGAQGRTNAVLVAAALSSVLFLQANDDAPPNGRELALVSGMRCEIVSLDNANSRYQVVFTFEEGPPSEDVHFIRLGNAVIQQSGRSRSRIVSDGVVRQSATLDFLLEGEELAERLAGIVGCDVRRRQHPGHRIVTRIVPMESEIRSDAPSAEAMIELQNVGGESLYILQIPFPWDHADPAFFVFGTVNAHQAMAAVGHNEAYVMNGPGMRTVQWKPGQLLSRKVDLKKHLALDQAGVYQLTGVYEIRFSGEPSSKDLIWLDYAVQTFTIQVVD